MRRGTHRGLSVCAMLKRKPIPRNWPWGSQAYYAGTLAVLALGLGLSSYLFATVGMPLITLGTMVVLVAGTLSSLLDFRDTSAGIYLVGTIGLVTTAISYLFLVKM